MPPPLRHRVVRRWPLIAFALVALALPRPAPPARAGGDGPLPLSALGPPRLTSAADGAAARIAPALRQAVATAGSPDIPLPVIVVSQGALPPGLLPAGVARRPDARGIVFTAGRVPAGRVSGLARQPSVVAVLSGAPPPPPDPPGLAARARPRPDHHATDRPTVDIPIPGPPAGTVNPKSKIQNPKSPESWHTVDVQDVRPAWDAGYRGAGVNVAVIDSGVDFGHPDLRGTYARVTDPASPYYGWPLAFDPTSMELLAGGIVGDAENAINADGSWYVDTSAMITGAAGSFTTLTAGASGLNPVSHVYQMPGTSRSGVYHIGIFPDEHLAFDVYGEYPVIVVADTHQAGVYDTVYVDLRDTHDLRTAVALAKGHEVGGVDLDGDGIPDLSTGLLYYIADGRHPVPASDWLYGLPAPGNGTLVAMMGSYDYDEHHGTACASSVVAQGVIDGDNGGLRPPYKPPGVGGMVQGMAPEAKLVAVGNVYRSGMAIYDAYTLVTYGLDGRPNTGDEPQIASLSFGFDGGVDSGWDFQSRYLAALQADNPALSVVAATGNGGPGYGTVTPPGAAPSIISVGAATQYGETTNFEPISSTLDITWGDIQPWSNRGPSILGNPAPLVLSVGAWGTADDALNYSRHGAIAYDIWGGTSMATPVTAGILALGYQAYRQATGAWPDAGTARELLASSARDLHYGPFSQGAGLADGLRLVELAAGQAGLRVSPARWVPGQAAPAYAGYLRAGDTATTTVTLANPTGAPIAATLAGDALREIGHYDWSVSTDVSRESPPAFTRPDYLQDLTGVIPPDADLLKVQAVFSYTAFTQSRPDSAWLSADNTWRLLAYDWQDKNGDGRLWIDANGNGAVNDGEIETGEYNRLWYSYPAGDMLEGYVERPLARVHTGLMIGLQHTGADPAIPSTAIRLRATFYKHTANAPIAVSPAAVTVPAHGQSAVTAAVAVPAGQPPGSYEAAIDVATADDRIVLPVALNVALPALQGQFGGTPPAPTTYDSGRVSGALNWAWRADAGEWRTFFALNPAPPPPNTYLWAHTTWPHYPSDFDTFLLGAAPGDYFSATDPARFGPSGLWYMGGSTYNYEGGGQWQWATNTGTTAEWVSGPLTQAGLHEVVLHNDWYSGADFSEPFTGTLGAITLGRAGFDLTSDSPQGSATLSVTTAISLPAGLTVNGYGLSRSMTLPDLPIQAQGTYFYELALSHTASVEFRTSSAGPIDLYLYVDYFDGQRWNWLTGSGGGGPDQAVRIEPVRDGRYRVRVDGGPNVPPGATFNLTIRAVHGTDLTVSPPRIPGPLAPSGTYTFTVSYNRPGLPPGDYDGQVFVGPTDAPALVSLPLTLHYGHPTPVPTATPAPCAPEIRDVPADYWARPFIVYLYCHGVVAGYLDRTFHPGALTSRVQFVAMLGRAQNWSLVSPATPTFRDVPPTFWGYAYVETAAQAGLISGYAGGTFRPVALITRAQVAKLLVRAAGWPARPGPAPFRDVPAAYWAAPYIAQAAAHGLVAGYADGTFRPALPATRAELARMLYGFLQP